MRDFLSNLLDRSFNYPGKTEFVRPRVPSMFEPAHRLPIGSDEALSGFQENERTSGDDSSKPNAAGQSETTGRILEKHTSRTRTTSRDFQDIERSDIYPSAQLSKPDAVRQADSSKVRRSDARESEGLEQPYQYINAPPPWSGTTWIKAESEGAKIEGQEPSSQEERIRESLPLFSSGNNVKRSIDHDPALSREATKESSIIPPSSLKPMTYPFQQTNKPDILSKEKPAPTIHVTIGRIEVRATTQTVPSQKNRPVTQAMGLDEYLLKRNGGGR